MYPPATAMQSCCSSCWVRLRNVTGYSGLIFAHIQNHQQGFNAAFLTQRLCLPCCDLVKCLHLQVWATEGLWSSHCAPKGKAAAPGEQEQSSVGRNDEAHSTLRSFCPTLGLIYCRIICPATDRSQAVIKLSNQTM